MLNEVAAAAARSNDGAGVCQEDIVWLQILKVFSSVLAKFLIFFTLRPFFLSGFTFMRHFKVAGISQELL